MVLRLTGEELGPGASDTLIRPQQPAVTLAAAPPPGPRPGAATRGAIQLMVARCVFLASGLVISIVLARALGPASFGDYGVVMSVLTWVQLVFGIGMTGATVKLLAENAAETPTVEQTARVLFVVCSLVLVIPGWTLAPVLAGLFAMESGAVLFRVAMLDLPLMALFLAYQGILHGHGRFGTLSVALIMHTLAKLSGIIVLLGLGVSVLGAMVVHVLATAAVLVYLLVRFPPDRTRPSGVVARAMMRIALPLSLYSVALQILSNLSLWLLKGVGSAPEDVTGFYVGALNLARSLGTVQTVLSSIVFMSLSWALARGDLGLAQRRLQQAVRGALVVLAPSCLLLIAEAEPLMNLVYGSRYSPGATMLRYQAVAFAVLVFVDTFSAAAMAAGRFASPSAILLCLVPLAVALNAVLIPAHGGDGAALAFMASTLVGAMITLRQAHRHFGAIIHSTTVWRVGVALVVPALLSHLLPLTGAWLIAKLVMLFAVYAVILALLKELTIEDVRPLAGWLTRRS